MTKNPLKSGPLNVLICYLLCGFLPLFWKQLDSISSLWVAAARIVLSTLACALFLTGLHGWDGVKAAVRDRKILRRTWLCGLLVSVEWLSYIWAVNSGHILDASLAYYIEPILAVGLGAVFFREKLTKAKWLGALLAVIGCAVPILYHGTFPFIALVIGGAFALYGAVKKTMPVEGLCSTFLETLAVSPFALAFILWAEANGRGACAALSGWQFALIPMIGLASSIPQLFFARGVKTTPYSLSGILMYVNPTIQLLLGVFLYQESFTWVDGLMFGFVWAGVLLFVLSDLRHAKHIDA